MIAIEDLQVLRRGFALGPLELEVASGEYFVLLGPSGSGKTTLLEWIAGFVESRRGALRLEGREATSLPPQERALGVVYQDSALFPNMNVRENLGFSLRMRGEDKSETRRHVEEVAERLHISHLLDASVRKISNGEKRRVALGRTLVAGRRVLLLDEPLTGLDPALRREMRFELRNIQRELGLTIFHITHLLDEARILADRIGIILDGQLLQTGRYEELANEPADARVAATLGVENFVAGTVSAGTLECAGAKLPMPAQADGEVKGRVTKLILSLGSPGSGGVAGLFQGLEPGPHSSSQALVRVGQGADETGLLLHARVPEGVSPEGLRRGQEVHIDFSEASWHLY